MKQTRRCPIRNRILGIEDLKRIAGVFDKQAELARKSEHHHSVTYTIYFADDSSAEADTPAILEDDVIQIKRPVKIQFDFTNYKLDRRLAFSVTHGNSEYGNDFWIRPSEDAWLNDNYTKLEGFVNGARPQSHWLSRHPGILTHLLALGIGTLGMLLMDVMLAPLPPPRLNISPSGVEKIKAVATFVNANRIWFYLGGWVWRWFAGFFWGAFPVANWVLGAWPTIELDLGAEHLKAEKRRREKIFVGVTLVVAPVLLSILQDIIKRAI